MNHFSGYLRREDNPFDYEFNRSLHQHLRSLILIRDQQERMIRDTKLSNDVVEQIITDSMEIEKAFREDNQ